MSNVVSVKCEQPYFIAETTMPGKTGFDFNGASQSFNVLAEYLFGKVVQNLILIFIMSVGLMIFY